MAVSNLDIIILKYPSLLSKRMPVQLCL